MSALILADTREGNGANPYLGPVISENNKTNSKLSKTVGGGNIKFKIKQITVGDYCIFIKNKLNTKDLLAMVIERKTWKDLAASIKDNRMLSQHKKLIEIQKTKGCKLLYIIEGKFNYKDDFKVGNIPFKNLHAKLRHNIIRDIPFIQSKSEDHTAKIIVDMARDLLKMYSTDEVNFPLQECNLTDACLEEMLLVQKKYIELFNKNNIDINQKKMLYDSIVNNFNNLLNITNSSIEIKTTQQLEQINKENKENKEIDQKPEPELHNFKQPEPELHNFKQEKEEKTGSYEIPKELTTNKIYEDSDIIMKMWSSLPGITEKSAVVLMENYKIYDIICAKKDNIDDIKKNIADIKFNSGIRFGETKAAKVTDLAYNGENPELKKKVYELSIGILACVPGISKPTAKLILDKHTLRDICNGFVDEDKLLEIKNNNNRRINKKSISKIFALLNKAPSIN